ncbi:MAG TPA: TadE family protein [Virgibacillus sp.]|nr:TadE family protein [Virgibacillus sp.]
MATLQLRDEDGSITLEAAFVLPIFMVFIVFMASFIRISIAEINLNKAVSETTEVIATHAYPATILSNGVESVAEDKVSGISSNLLSLSELEDFANTTLKDVFDLDISASGFINDLSESIIQKEVKKRYKENTDSSFEPDISVELDLPTSINGSSEGSYLGVTASYDLGLNVPFMDYTITLKKKGYGRLWTGAH